MLTPEEAVARVRKRVADRWATAVWAETTPAQEPTTAQGPTRPSDEESPAGGPAPGLAGPAATWPHTLALGRPSSADLGANFGTFIRQVHDWRTWAATQPVGLREQDRRVSGTAHRIPSHLVLGTLDDAAQVAEEPWPALVATARHRAAHIRDQHPAAVDPVRALRAAAHLSDVDFDVASRAANWFTRRAAATLDGHAPELLTPRQVPIDGVHAKWLNNHQALVRNLAGLDDLHLTAGHPARIHFTYLDPDHRATGRRHDSYSVGDHQFTLPYEPQVIVISENKDTAVGFPPMPGAISVEGAGTGGGTIAATPWVRQAPLVVYWGDLDVDGLRILNEFRAAGVPAKSILMDLPTYEAYLRYGTNTDKNDDPIKLRPGAEPVHLTDAERELYDHLTGPGAVVLRVEQERIPLPVAASHVERLRHNRPATR
jgi:hypothetical protein